MPLSPESSLYTTFITPFDRFYLNRLPFSIASAPEHFQRHMSMIIDGIEVVSLNMEKCELSRSKFKFLGHILSADGVQPDPDKVKAVIAMRGPSNTGEVRSFLGLLHQLGKYIPSVAEIDKPLRNLLSKNYQLACGCRE